MAVKVNLHERAKAQASKPEPYVNQRVSVHCLNPAVVITLDDQLKIGPWHVLNQDLTEVKMDEFESIPREYYIVVKTKHMDKKGWTYKEVRIARLFLDDNSKLFKVVGLHMKVNDHTHKMPPFYLAKASDLDYLIRGVLSVANDDWFIRTRQE